MPRSPKSAEAIGLKEGDVRTHSWKISIAPDVSIFIPDAKFATYFLTLDFTCLKCHGDRNIKWASMKAKGILSYGK